MKYCSNCGKELNAEMSFCPSCGKQINTSKTDDQKISENKMATVTKKPGTDTVLFIGSCVSIAVIFFSLFLPYITVEVLGTRNVSRLIQGDGVFFIILLLALLISVIMKKDIPHLICSFFICLLTIFEINSLSRKIIETNTSEDNLFNIDFSNLIQKDTGYYFLILGVLLNTVVIIAKTILKKNKAAAIILIASLSVIMIISGIITYCKKPNVKYSLAKTMFETGNYKLSAILYSSIGNYEDSKERGMEALCAHHYKLGKDLMNEGKYDEAIAEFNETNSYQDSADLIGSCYYEKGVEAFNNGDPDTALDCLLNAGKSDEITDMRLKIGKELTETGKYAKAVSAFEYQRMDTETKKYLSYSRAMLSDEEGRYQEAAEFFSQAGDVLDAKEKLTEEHYKCGTKLMEDKNYTQALLHFGKIPEYSDSKTMSDACHVLEIKSYIDEGKLNKAKEELDNIPNNIEYKDLSTDNLRKILTDNEKWLNICGNWTSTGGTIKTREEGSYGYYQDWHRDISENEFRIEVRCIPQENGKVLVKCNADILVFTNYSSVKEFLKGETINVSGSSEMSEPSSFEAGKYTTITISEDSIKLSYKKVENNYASFDDIYTTEITYGNRAIIL